MADEEYEQATPEQKLSIASYFISSSPTGEVNDVLIDVAKLIDDKSVLTEAKIAGIMKSYNEEQMQPVALPEGSLLITTYGKAGGDDEYVDPVTGKVFKVDHRKHTIAGETEMKQSLPDNIKEYRDAAGKAMDVYAETQYRKGKCNTSVFGSDDGNLKICISARDVNLPNFKAGGWCAVYTINVGTKGTTEMKGSIKTNVHYFEDGNVQLHGAIEKTAQINVQDAESTAAAIKKAISEIETNYQTNLNEMYVMMHQSTFKQFRRFLPVTKQPMNWNKYAHNLKS